MQTKPDSPQHRRLPRLLATALLAIAAAGLLWQVVGVNLAQHSLVLNAENKHWQQHHADFLIRQAALKAASEPDTAITLLGQAVLEKPVDARVYLYAGLAYDAKQDRRQAEAMMRYAQHFGPRMTDNQLQLADFWVRHGHIGQSLLHMSAAMESRPALQAKLFPLLLQLAAMPDSLAAFQSLLATSPRWWPAFFDQALQKADAALIAALYEARQQATAAVPQEERQRYMDYLIREHRSLQAYALWLEQLTAEQLAVLGYINDGSFQQPASNAGFGWRFHRGRGWQLSRFEGSGALSAPSLRIGFYGGRLAAQELASQYTMLEPGQYSFRAMFKLESLNAGEGVQWKLSCSNGSQLGSGQLLSGSRNWSGYTFVFTVPDSAACNIQKLALIASPGGSRPFDYEGYAWFDELVIEKAGN